MSDVVQLHPDKQLTPKQEAFVQAYLECRDMSEAYRRAYNTENMKPETINRNAWELAHNHPKVAARIKQEQDAMRQAHKVTLESLLAELEEARVLALSEKQAGAASQATMGKAKLTGHVIEKTENKTELLDHRGEKPDFATAQKRAGLGVSG